MEKEIYFSVISEKNQNDNFVALISSFSNSVGLRFEEVDET